MFGKSQCKIMMGLLLLLGSSMSCAFPSCVLDKFNLTAREIRSFYNSTQGVFFIGYDKNHPHSVTDQHWKYQPQMTVAIDQDCNLLYRRESKDSFGGMFELDDTSGIVFALRSSGRTYAIDAYLTKRDSKTGKMTVKPALLDLFSGPGSPQFNANNPPPPDIIICHDPDKICDIYIYNHSKEEYLKEKSYTCGDLCDVCGVYYICAKETKRTKHHRAQPKPLHSAAALNEIPAETVK